MLLPSSALATPGDVQATGRYVSARLAEGDGAPAQAAADYALLLAASPDDLGVALHAYRGGLAGGDTALALRAARLLDARGALPAEGRLLLFAEGVSKADWRAARDEIAKIEAEDGFGFVAPILRAWVNFSARDGATVALLDARGAGLTAAYAGEHRALLLLAEGDRDAGVTAMTALLSTGQGVAGQGVRIAAAARLAKLGERKAAGALLSGADPALSAARATIERRGKLPHLADGAGAGLALLMTRLADDIGRQQASPLALSLLRIATLLDPDCDPAHLMAAELSGESALASLDRIGPRSAWRTSASDARVLVLVKRGEREAALQAALAATRVRGATAADWARLGALQADLGRHGDAATAFTRAVALADDDWRLWLQLGSAQDRAGDWAHARVALATAARLAPDQPIVLNYLGYAQLERGENLDEAERLIREASRLRPQDAAITDSLGWAQLRRGDIATAIATLERAVAGEPGEPVINEHLGDAYWQAGRRIDARYAWNAALLSAEEPDAERLRGKLDIGLP